MRTAAMFALILLTGAPVAGNQPASSPKNATQLGALRPAQSNDPYRQLFNPGRDVMQKALSLLPPTPKAKVVCGMLVIPADPTLDPKMAATPPQDTTLEYRIRAQEPPVCSPAK